MNTRYENNRTSIDNATKEGPAAVIKAVDPNTMASKFEVSAILVDLISAALENIPTREFEFRPKLLVEEPHSGELGYPPNVVLLTKIQLEDGVIVVEGAYPPEADTDSDPEPIPLESLPVHALMEISANIDRVINNPNMRLRYDHSKRGQTT
jgi:hypothetical protein